MLRQRAISIVADYPSIDPHVQNEERDFVDEAIAFLRCVHKVNMRTERSSDEWKSRMHELTNRQRKHLVLYNRIATTIVRETHGDVAAVTVYRLKDEKGAMVYYAKNAISTDDLKHINQFAEIVRKAACQPISRSEFQTRYFQLLFENCRGKLDRRFQEVRDVLLNKEYGNSRSLPIEQLKIVLENNLKEPSIDPFGGREKGNADKEALKLTGVENIYTALIMILNSMEVYVRSPATVEVVQSLSGQAWIIGRSVAFEETKKTAVALLVQNVCQKFGEYYRGTSQLHEILYDHRWNKSLRNVQFRAVPPAEPQKPVLNSDWYRVLETIYTRATGKPMAVSSGRLSQRLQGVVNEYRSWCSPDRSAFVRHAEVQLIEYLMAHKMPPDVVGISKLCCSMCNAWIDNVNSHHYIHLWRVSGCHGRLYPWGRNPDAHSEAGAAELAVQHYVYQKIVDVVRPFIPDFGESPAHEYDSKEGAGADATKLAC